MKLRRTNGFLFIAFHQSRAASSLLLLLFLAPSCTLAQNQPHSGGQPPDALLAWMNSIAGQDLATRSEAIHSIHTIAQADERKNLVRKAIIEDLGGLPAFRTPLRAQITGRIHTNVFTIEKVLYQSLPGFYVTANLYRPNAPGRYPAVLLQAGHTQEGKTEDQLIASDLAAKGFVVLCFDPIGQGERTQTYSHQLEAPLAGWSVPEHILLDAQSQLIGQGLARYFLWDAMRSLDYLTSLPDVDPARIGIAGCSGGGALTTFLGALDPRVKAVVAACYPSSFQQLFPTAATHGEMVVPHLMASGLDTADFIELSAPTPWQLQATTADQLGFSVIGVRQVYNEARDWYRLYRAGTHISFEVAPGPHGFALSSRDALYAWMIRWLKDEQGDPHEQPVPMFPNHALQVTPTGHVEDLPGSRKLYQLLRDELRARERTGTPEQLHSELRRLGIPTDGSAPAVRILSSTEMARCSRQKIQIQAETGIWLDAGLYRPLRTGRRPAVLLVGAGEEAGKATETMAEEMAGRGYVVLTMEPRTSLQQNTKGALAGDWLTNMQANLIGRNLPSMRAHDILRAVDLLRSLPQVDPNSIRAAAQGVPGIWLLLAAAAFPHFQEIWLDKTPASIRSALNGSVTADLWDAVIPGFVLHWDLTDLVHAAGASNVLWTDPTNWQGKIIALKGAYRYRYVVGDLTDRTEIQDEDYLRAFLQ